MCARARARACADSSDAQPISALRAEVLKARTQIIKMADVQETSFYKVYPPSIFVHDQRVPGESSTNSKVAPEGAPAAHIPQDSDAKKTEVKKNSGEISEAGVLDVEQPKSVELGVPDDFHSPVKPDDYIRLRLYKMMAFYRSRLPRYSNARQLYSLLILLGASVGAVISFIGYSAQVAIISAVTSGITAWTEFVSTERKVSRYSACIVALEDIILWWDSLSNVEKNSPVNIHELIHAGWVPTFILVPLASFSGPAHLLVCVPPPFFHLHLCVQRFCLCARSQSFSRPLSSCTEISLHPRQ